MWFDKVTMVFQKWHVWLGCLQHSSAFIRNGARIHNSTGEPQEFSAVFQKNPWRSVHRQKQNDACTMRRLLKVKSFLAVSWIWHSHIHISFSLHSHIQCAEFWVGMWCASTEKMTTFSLGCREIWVHRRWWTATVDSWKVSQSWRWEFWIPGWNRDAVSFFFP